MENLIKIDTVDQYNKMFGLETLHPLVSVVDLSKSETWPTNFRVNYGIYGLFLKDTKCGDIRYGRQYYDYQEGTVIGFAPGQVTGIELKDGTRPLAHGLLFHPDLIRGTALGRDIKRYSFFSYESNEALHLSEEEKGIFVDCLRKIQIELEHSIDKHSKRLIAMNIELLLDYCLRFYDRQFTTRAETNKDVLVRFERLLDEYLQSDLLRQEGLPTVRYFAEKICLSPNYFGDLIKKETGKTAQENIQDRIISLAKEWILGTNKTVSQIAYDLGFQICPKDNNLLLYNIIESVLHSYFNFVDANVWQLIDLYGRLRCMLLIHSFNSYILSNSYKTSFSKSYSLLFKSPCANNPQRLEYILS